MANKKQRKAEKLRRRDAAEARRKTRQRQEMRLAPRPVSPPRLAAHVPRPWTNELPEDVALFDSQVRATLAPELALQADAVLQSFELVRKGEADAAFAQVADIPRKSPYADWRVFVRGWSAWLEGRFEDAAESWSRLDRQRRPGRMATALNAAIRLDLDSITPPDAATVPPSAPPEPREQLPSTSTPIVLDRANLFAAKIARRLTLARPGIDTAESILAARESAGNMTIDLRTLKWLDEFAVSHMESDPDLVKALQKEALCRAFAQPDPDAFQAAVNSFSGPPHDPANNLLACRYYMQFANLADCVTNYREEYLKRDLPRFALFSEPLRNAIHCLLRLESAGEDFVLSESELFLTTPAWYDDGEGDKKTSGQFREAIAAYPTYNDAHAAYADWLKSRIDSKSEDRLDTSFLEEELLSAMTTWTRDCPNAIEPRLWLVDYYFDNEEFLLAKSHVEWLAESRHENPNVRAVPWRCHLLQAFQAARKKATLDQVAPLLDRAAELWPAWYPQDWLPYFRAALLLRQGDRAGFDLFRQQQGASVEASGHLLLDACMMLGAAQRMHVTGASLKPLREPIEKRLQGMANATTDDLVSVLAFFWELHRVSLTFSAVRTYSSKLGKEVLRRFQRETKWLQQNVAQPRVVNAVLYLGERRFFAANGEPSIPLVLPLAAKNSPRVAAALVRAAVQSRSRQAVAKNDFYVDTVRSAVETESDAYYRYWFKTLVEQYDQRLRSFDRDGARDFFELFRQFAGGSDDDDDDSFYEDLLEDEDDGLPFDPMCSCENCTAKRAEYARKPGP